MVDFNCVIVGAGMMGAAAARHLSLVEEGIGLIGPGEPLNTKSHRGVFASHYDQARITRSLDADPVWADLALHSIARYRDIEKRSGISFYDEVGCLFFGAPSGLCDSYLGSAKSIGEGLGTQLISKPNAQMRTDFPMFAFDADMVGLYERFGAGHINPRKLVEAQCKLAAEQGVRLIRSTVTSITSEDGHLRLSCEDGSSWSAGRVLIAAGGFTNMNGLLPKPLAIRPTQKTIVFFELDEARQAEFSAMPSTVKLAANEDEIVYILPPVHYPDGKVYLKIGGESEKTEVPDLEAAAQWFGSDGNPQEVASLTDIVTELMPALRGAPVTSGSCVATMTQSGYPYIGFIDGGKVAVLTGGNFVSAKSSDELGRLGAELMHRGELVGKNGALFEPRFAPL